MGKHFTWDDDVYPALKRAIELKGKDYVYKAPGEYGYCVNWDLDESGNMIPSCIVGHVIMDLLPDHEIRKGTSWTEEAENILKLSDATFDRKSDLILARVQGYQDNGIPWGQALSAAMGDVVNGPLD